MSRYYARVFQFLPRCCLCQGLWLLLTAMLLLGFSDPVSAQPAGRSNPKFNVLILHSYHQGYEWTDSIHDAIMASLKQSGLQLDIFIEYMDTIRQPWEKHLEMLFQLYQERYGHNQPRFFDVIIVSDDNALNFMLEHREVLFGKVPLVFCGINEFDPGRIEGVSSITGVNEELSVRETIELALYLADRPRKVTVIAGSGLTARRNLQIFKEAAAIFHNQIDMFYLLELEPDELLKHLETLNADDVIFYLSYLSTPSGRSFSVHESIDLITTATPAKIFSFWDFMVTRGVLGGKVVHGRSQGQVAARMALQILGGKKANEIPVLMKSPNQYLLDGRVLDQYKLTEKHLPVNAIVTNRLPRYLIEEWDNLIKDSFFGYDLFENHGSVMLIMDPLTGVILDANRSARMYYGYDKLDGMNISEISTLTPTEIEREMAAAASLNRNYFNFKHRLADGSIRNVEVYSYPIQVQDKQVLFSIVIDATAKIMAEKTVQQRNQLIFGLMVIIALTFLGAILFLLNNMQRRQSAEDALRKSENLLHKVFDTLPIGLWIADENGTLLRGNPAGRKIWGDEPLVAQPQYGVFKARRFPSGEEIAPEDWALAHTIKRKVSVEDELLEIDAFDGQKKIILNYTFPVLNGNGQLEGAVVVNQDITSRYHAEKEKEKLQDQLLQAQKLESVGRLAGGVAHDFNNKLQAILGYCEMAIAQTGQDRGLQKYLQEIHTAAQGSAHLTRQLLAFARKQAVVPQVLDLNQAISGMLRMLQRLIGEDIELIWQGAPNLWPVRMDPTQIDQILANLAVNARDAMKDTGRLTVETRNVRLTDDNHDGQPDFNPGEYVLLEVRDTGTGIPPDVLEHIFEPFFTTKEVGKGTGLGLATVYGIVKQNEGFIRVFSHPDKGTAFKLYLPRTTAQKTENTSADTKPEGGSETVLLVEDETTILKLGHAILEHFGYRVLSAASPHAALEIADSYPGAIDLLVTDVVMPEMNGKTLYNRLMIAQPNMKVLYMSGYTADIISQHGVLDSGITFLEKPFSADTLATAVRNVLNSYTFNGHNLSF